MPYSGQSKKNNNIQNEQGKKQQQQHQRWIELFFFLVGLFNVPWFFDGLIIDIMTRLAHFISKYLHRNKLFLVNDIVEE